MGKLTVAQIRALKEPGRYSDGDGLILEFTRPGRAYWFVRVQHNGRRRDIGLGPVDEITLAKARDKAHEARKSLANGIDPTIERQKAKLKVPTFREAAKLVHEEHKAAWKNGKRPLSDMTLLKILRDMDVPATVQGFRSTFRGWVAEETDYPGEIAEAALAHAIPNKVEAAYRRTDFLEKRRALMRDWDRYSRGSSG